MSFQHISGLAFELLPQQSVCQTRNSLIWCELAWNSLRSAGMSVNSQLTRASNRASQRSTMFGTELAPPARRLPNKELENKGLILWSRNCSPSNSVAKARPRRVWQGRVAPYGVIGPDSNAWQEYNTRGLRHSDLRFRVLPPRLHPVCVITTPSQATPSKPLSAQ